MKNIFIGMLMVILDFILNSNSCSIGLIPDFIGYIVMTYGLIEVAEESIMFSKVKPFAIGMAVYSGILYAKDLFGISYDLGIISLVLGLVSTIVSLYISYNIVMGIKEIEVNRNTYLNGDSLRTTWIILAICSVLDYLPIIIPVFALINIIATFIISIVFLFVLNRAKDLYYEV